jgi:hypothetical protein
VNAIAARNPQINELRKRKKGQKILSDWRWYEIW